MHAGAEEDGQFRGANELRRKFFNGKSYGGHLNEGALTPILASPSFLPMVLCALQIKSDLVYRHCSGHYVCHPQNLLDICSCNCPYTLQSF